MRNASFFNFIFCPQISQIYALVFFSAYREISGRYCLCLRQIILPGTMETGRQGSCFGSQEHLRTCGMVEDIPYIGKCGKPWTSASSYLGKSLSLSGTGMIICFSTGEMQLEHSVQHSGCRSLRQGNWKGSTRDWFLDQLIK